MGPARSGGGGGVAGAEAAAYLPVPEEFDDDDDLEADGPLRVVLPATNGRASSAGEAAKLSPVKRPEDRV
jgi:hypothetical protein